MWGNYEDNRQRKNTQRGNYKKTDKIRSKSVRQGDTLASAWEWMQNLPLIERI